jgi:GDP-L-fucose synthase
MNKDSKIYIAGHTGMVGSAILRQLKKLEYTNFVLKTSKELDLLNQEAVFSFFESEKPEIVFLAAAKVGGIKANNTLRADFIYENLMIQNNVIHASFINKVQKLIFLGSSCIYPKNAPQPLKEEYLLTGKLEDTNEPYAIAKIAGIKLCENYFKQYGCNFISLMPTNMFGENDNYDLDTSHVLPALIRKIHLAKAYEENDFEEIECDLIKNSTYNKLSFSKEEILIFLQKHGIEKNQDKVQLNMWGSGNPMREFMAVDDFAEICIELTQNIDAEKLYNDIGETHINVGTGKDISIKDLAQKIKSIIGFKGEFSWGSDKMDGTIKKCMDVSLMHQIVGEKVFNLDSKIEENYQKYISN